MRHASPNAKKEIDSCKAKLIEAHKCFEEATTSIDTIVLGRLPNSQEQKLFNRAEQIRDQARQDFLDYQAKSLSEASYKAKIILEYQAIFDLASEADTMRLLRALIIDEPINHNDSLEDVIFKFQNALDENNKHMDLLDDTETMHLHSHEHASYSALRVASEKLIDYTPKTSEEIVIKIETLFEFREIINLDSQESIGRILKSLEPFAPPNFRCVSKPFTRAPEAA